MKKIFALGLFIVTLVLSTNKVSAQSSDAQIDAQASRYASTMAQEVKLNKTQKEQVFQIVKKYISKTESVQQHEPENTEVLATLKTYRDNQLRAILTQEQIDLYQTFAEKHN